MRMTQWAALKSITLECRSLERSVCIGMIRGVFKLTSRSMRFCSEKGTTVAWRGNNLLPHTHGMDVISRHYIESEGLNFVDTRGIMEYFKADIAAGAAKSPLP